MITLNDITNSATGDFSSGVHIFIIMGMTFLFLIMCIVIIYTLIAIYEYLQEMKRKCKEEIEEEIVKKYKLKKR